MKRAIKNQGGGLSLPGELKRWRKSVGLVQRGENDDRKLFFQRDRILEGERPAQSPNLDRVKKKSAER